MSFRLFEASISEDNEAIDRRKKEYIENKAKYIGIEKYFSLAEENDAKNGEEMHKNINSILSQIESMKININDFIHDNRYDKIDIRRNEGNYLFFRELYFGSLKKVQIISKMGLDINLKHSQILPLFGVYFDEFNEELIEVRKIEFEPIQLSIQNLTNLERTKRNKTILEIIRLTKFLCDNQCSMTLLSLDDFLKYSIFDRNFNLYFGDTSFIDIENNIQKNLFSMGIIVSQLLGFNLILNTGKIIEKLEFSVDFPLFWKLFINANWIDHDHIQSFLPPFTKHENKIYIEMDKENEFLYHYHKLIEHKQVEFTFKIRNKSNEDKKNITIKEARNFLSNYDNLLIRKPEFEIDDRFKHFKVQKGENIFIFKEQLESENRKKLISKFETLISLDHPILAQIKGIRYDNSLIDKINIYRQIEGTVSEIKMICLNSIQKIIWLRQIHEFFTLITSKGIHLKHINDYKHFFESHCVLDSENNIKIVRFPHFNLKEENLVSDNLKFYWEVISFFIDFKFNELSLEAKHVLLKEPSSRSITDFFVIGNFLSSPKNVGAQIREMLDKYDLERTHEGKNCKSYFYNYKRNQSHYDRLILKEYDQVFESSALDELEFMRSKKHIIEYWTEESQSFVLMINHYNSESLKSFLKKHKYCDKVKLIKNIALLISEFEYHPLNGFSEENIFVNENLSLCLVDCLPITRNTTNKMLDYGKLNLDFVSFVFLDCYVLNISYSINEQIDFEPNSNISDFWYRLVGLANNSKNYPDRPSMHDIYELIESYTSGNFNIDKLFEPFEMNLSRLFLNPDGLVFDKKSDFVELNGEKYLFDTIKGYGNESLHILRQNLLCYKFSHQLPISFFTVHNSDLILLLNAKFKISLDKLMLNDEDDKIGILKIICEYIDSVFSNNVKVDIKNLSLFLDSKNEIKALFTNVTDYNLTDESKFEFISNIIEKIFPLNKPPLIDALIYRLQTGPLEKRPSINQIVEIIDRRYEKFIENVISDNFVTFHSTKKPDFVESGLRIEIISRNSYLRSYIRENNIFKLYYGSTPDLTFLKHLHLLDCVSLEGNKCIDLIRTCEIEKECNNGSIITKVLKKDDKKLILFEYSFIDSKIVQNDSIFNLSNTWSEYYHFSVLGDYEPSTSLYNIIKKCPTFFDTKFKESLIARILNNCGRYYRYSPTRIYLKDGNHDPIIFDCVELDSSNCKVLKDDYCAPECVSLASLCNSEKELLNVYSIGLIALEIFGGSFELNEKGKLKSLTFPLDIPMFWRDFVSLCTRDNAIDRPTPSMLVNALKNHQFSDEDFLIVSEFFIDSNDFDLCNPIGSGGESVVYLAINKKTQLKHACKALNCSYSDLRHVISYIRSSNSKYGIKYLGTLVTGRSGGTNFLTVAFYTKHVKSPSLLLNEQALDFGYDNNCRNR